MRQVIDDLADFRGTQYPSLDLAADCFKTVGRWRRRNGHEIALRLGKAPERRFGQADAAGANQRIVIRNQERRKQDPGITAQLDAAEAAKQLRAQCLRPSRDDHDILAARIEIDPNDAEARSGRVGGDHEAAYYRRGLAAVTR